jgi:hypothetical protein
VGAELEKNCYGAAAAACRGLWRQEVVFSDWLLYQHWLLYGGMVGGSVAAEKNARRQNIALKIYAESTVRQLWRRFKGRLEAMGAD